MKTNNKSLDYYLNLNYRIEIIEDKQEGGYTLHHPDLPGCITCSESIEEGLELIKDAKKCWLEACIEDEFPIPEPTSTDDYSGQFKIRIPKSLHRMLANYSKQEGVSMNQLCVHLLSKGVATINNH